MKRNNRGLTLVEVMVASTVMLFVIIAVYSLIVTTQTTHLTEGRKLDMNQGARVIEQILYNSFRGAGSVVSVFNTPGFVGGAIPFTGIYPLNNVNYPDGVILTGGDPEAVTQLLAPFQDTDGIINVNTTLKPDGTPAWFDNDIGLVMRSDGYYVFRVQVGGVAPQQLTIRPTAVYYSGLLNTSHYNDLSDEQLGSTGISATYAVSNPVLRLNFFSIFLVRTEADGSLTLTMTSDCEGVGDVLGVAPTATRGVPILANIGDIQIEYLSKATPPVVWASSEVAHTNPCPPGNETGVTCLDFINNFITKNIASARIYVLLRTEEERNKSAGSGVTYQKPDMGDTPASVLPVGRFHYTYMQYEVLLRNYDLTY